MAAAALFLTITARGDSIHKESKKKNLGHFYENNNLYKRPFLATF